MNINIINNKGVFEIHGSFTKENTPLIKDYFDNLLDTYYEIVICLKGVQEVDVFGLNVMKFITQKGVKRSKIVFVLGKKNKRIIRAFQHENLINIFKNDYTS